MALPEELTKDWPAEVKTDPTLKDVNDVLTLAKNLIHTKSFVGASIRPPSADAPPEARLEFVNKLREKVPELVLLPDGDDEPAKLAREVAMQRLGKPKEAKEYVPPKDAELAPEHLEALRARALKLGLTKSQFAIEAQIQAADLAAVSQARKEQQAALRRDLGAAFDERTAAAAAAAAKLGFPESVVAALKNGTMSPAEFKPFADIAKALGEKPHVAEQGGGGGGGKPTPAEAQAQRAELMARREYFNPKPHELGIHKSLVEKVQALNALIDG